MEVEGVSVPHVAVDTKWDLILITWSEKWQILSSLMERNQDSHPVTKYLTVSIDRIIF